MASDADVIFIIGIVLAVLSVPAMISAYSDGRAPRAATIAAVIAGVMIVYAAQTHPGGYTWRDVPEAFIRVAAGII
ncbi:MAG: hypothetical protein RIG84_11545 [Roseovarius sp.]